MSKRYGYNDVGVVSRETLAAIVSAPFLRTEYNYDTDLASVESGLRCEDESRAKQAFVEESDINTIVRRFGITGQLQQGVRMPTYDDFTVVTDFRTAIHAVMDAEESFSKLPADVRTRFQNSPALFVDFCSDASNREEAIKLGLVPAAEVVAPAGEVVAS